MGKPRSRCCASYRPTWDTVTRCELPEKHKGPHGPEPKPQAAVPAPLRKPALAQEHSETSKEAARQIEPHRRGLLGEVYAYFRSTMGANGLTDEEGAEGLDMNPSTYRPRRIELEEANLIHKTGQKRATKSGRKAYVYVATR